MSYIYPHFWRGRLGNNISQVMNAIHIGLYYNINILLLSHYFFNNTTVVINETKILDIDKEKHILDINTCFYNNEIIDSYFVDNSIYLNNYQINKECFKMNNEKVIKIIRELFIFKYNDLKPLNNNDLTIHIRSGDIISSNINCSYIIPPLSYYIKIIESGNYDNIYLLCEDTLNPCTNELLKLYPKIQFKINDIVDDIKIVLSSTNIVMSYGSFIPALSNMSDYIQKIYMPSYTTNEHYDQIHNDKIEIIKIDLDDYKKKIGNWVNSKKNYDFLLERL